MAHRNSKADQHRRSSRQQTRLVLPIMAADVASDDVLKSLVDTWLVRRLVEAFLQEEASNSGRPEEKRSGENSNGEKLSYGSLKHEPTWTTK
jgi:hypothetical protein